MNRFNQSAWSKIQSEMILVFLSFADYYRPRFFLLENVRNFVTFNKGQTFRLTLASLLKMGYQVDSIFGYFIVEMNLCSVHSFNHLIISSSNLVVFISPSHEWI